MDYSKLLNDNGMYLYIDNSFNTVSFELFFLAQNGNKESAIYDVLSFYLKRSNKKYNNYDEVNKTKKELYSLDFYCGADNYGSKKLFTFSFDAVSFDVVSDDYSSSLYDFMHNIIMYPDFTNEELLENIKEIVISNIQHQLVDDDETIDNLFYQKVFYEENREYDHSTDLEYISDLINSITLDDLKEAYEKLLNSFYRGIVFGNISEEQFKKFRKFIPFKNNDPVLDYSKNMIVKNEDTTISRDDLSESTIFVTYDIDNMDLGMINVISTIFNSSWGLCYQLLREKYGLVYSSYVASMFYNKKIYFYAKIDKNNKDKVLETIDEIIGIFNDKEKLEELLKLAKEKLQTQSYILSENKNSMDVSLDQHILGLFNGYDENEINRTIENMTVSDVQECIKTLKRKNIFMVRGDKNEE